MYLVKEFKKQISNLKMVKMRRRVVWKMRMIKNKMNKKVIKSHNKNPNKIRYKENNQRKINRLIKKKMKITMKNCRKKKLMMNSRLLGRIWKLLKLY